MRINIRNVFEGLAAVRAPNNSAGTNAYRLKFYGHGLFGIVGPA
jgi:hypothetical protein